MNSLRRFFAFGMEDADRRVAAFLQRRDHSAAERYLLASASLGSIDRLTQRLESWWLESETRRAAIAIAEAWSREGRSSRHRAVGAIFLVAVAAHVTLTMWQGAPAGSFWLLIPALAAAAGVLLLASAAAD